MRKIENITAVKGGMHIAFDRDLYEHHAIVERVNIIRNTLTVIDYYNTAGGYKSNPSVKASVVRRDVPFRSNIYEVVHDKEYYSPDQIVKRAQSH